MSMDFNSFLELFPGRVDRQLLNDLRQEREIWWEKGDGPKYRKVLDSLPEHKAKFNVIDDVVTLEGEPIDLLESAKGLSFWRKGPFNLFGTEIESEWRSDYKWNRLKDALPDLEEKTILDIGCNNGYFMFRMLEQNPTAVLGIDPVIYVKSQFDMINHFVKAQNMRVEMFGVEHITAFEHSFDVIFSMGILYHHRSPLQQLFDMRMALRPGGTLVLETIGIPGDEEVAITPDENYAGMKNIWLLPTLPMLIKWLERNKFIDIKVISTEWGGTSEQRKTSWSSGMSYEDFLDPNDHTKTVEGFPAPMRFILTASKK